MELLQLYMYKQLCENKQKDNFTTEKKSCLTESFFDSMQHYFLKSIIFNLF